MVLKRNKQPNRKQERREQITLRREDMLTYLFATEIEITGRSYQLPQQ
jgi:hypothetical protein